MEKKYWINFVPKRDKDVFLDLYSEYLDALPEDVQLKVIYGSNPGYHSISKSVHIRLKTPSGQEASLYLSPGSTATIQCTQDPFGDEVLSPEVYEEVRAIEQCFEKVSREKEQREGMAKFSGLTLDKSKHDTAAVLSRNLWLLPLLNRVPTGAICSLHQNGNGYDVSLDYKKLGIEITLGLPEKNDEYLRRLSKGADKGNFLRDFDDDAKWGVTCARWCQKIFQQNDLTDRSKRQLVYNTPLYGTCSALNEHKLQVTSVWAKEKYGYDYLNVKLAPDHPEHGATEGRAILECKTVRLKASRREPVEGMPGAYVLPLHEPNRPYRLAEIVGLIGKIESMEGSLIVRSIINWNLNSLRR